MILWAVSSFAEMLSDTFEMKVFWRNVTQIGVFMTPVATLMFILAYTEYLRSHRVLIARIAYTYQFIAVLLILTDFLHRWVRISITLSRSEPYQAVVVALSTFGKFLITGNFLLMLFALVLTIIAAFNSLRATRMQVYSVLLGIVVSLVYACIKVVSGEQFLQSVPISGVFALSGFFMLLGINRFNLLKLTPLAYEHTFRFLGDGIVVCTSDAKVVDANPAARTMLESNLSELEEHLKHTYSHWYALVLKGKQTNFAIQFKDRFFHADLFPITNKRMEPVGSVTLLKDITILEEQRLLLTEWAEKDGLTGLYNRQTFIDRVEVELACATEASHLLYFDIDHFKKINDTYGHRAGDLVLSELGALLTRWTEPKSITGRFGGEEFAVFSSSIDTKQARLRAEEFRKLVAQHLFVHEELELHVTISMGLASARTESFEQLYRLADTLLYQAKDEGRNRLCSGQDAGQSLQ